MSFAITTVSGFNAFHIFLGLASIPVVFTLIGCVYMAWSRRSLMKQRCCPRRRNSMKEDKNDVYGTYARGWGGEGDYGDGDKVYVEDANVYYGS